MSSASESKRRRAPTKCSPATPPPRTTTLEDCIEADGEAGPELRQLRQREQDTVGERLARRRVVADRQQLPFGAEDHFLVRDEAGQADRVDRRIAADQLRGRG